jgi:hypothetical protein
VGMGAFGLVWYVAFYVAQDIPKPKYILIGPIQQLLQLPVGSLGQNGGTEGFHDLFNCDWLCGQLVFGSNNWTRLMC